MSSCEAGTVFNGLNVYVGKSDPVALPDEEYPDWLWSVLDPPKKDFTLPEEMLSPEYLRAWSKKEIKAKAKAKGF